MSYICSVVTRILLLKLKGSRPVAAIFSVTTRQAANYVRNMRNALKRQYFELAFKFSLVSRIVILGSDTMFTRSNDPTCLFTMLGKTFLM